MVPDLSESPVSFSSGMSSMNSSAAFCALPIVEYFLSVDISLLKRNIDTGGQLRQYLMWNKVEGT